MNREIEFRGKHIDTREWVYGSLLIIDYLEDYPTFTDHVNMLQIVLLNGHAYDVFPETVGQLWKVIDEVEWYEGDILESKGDPDIKVIIQCNGDGFFTLYDEADSPELMPEYWCKIGNIYDNTELKGTEQ